jgi:hypothetical protein
VLLKRPPSQQCCAAVNNRVAANGTSIPRTKTLSSIHTQPRKPNLWRGDEELDATGKMMRISLNEEQQQQLGRSRKSSEKVLPKRPPSQQCYACAGIAVWWRLKEGERSSMEEAGRGDGSRTRTYCSSWIFLISSQRLRTFGFFRLPQPIGV